MSCSDAIVRPQALGFEKKLLGLLVVQKTAFRLPNLKENRIQIKFAIIDFNVPHNAFEDVFLIARIDDREIILKADFIGMLAQNPHAKTVESADGQAPGRTFAGRPRNELNDALTKLSRRFIREREPQNRRRRHMSRRNEMGDPISHRARLAASRACENQEGPLRMQDGFPLIGVEAVQVEGHPLEVKEIGGEANGIFTHPTLIFWRALCLFLAT
jgi:hypothetical protein